MKEPDLGRSEVSKELYGPVRIRQSANCRTPRVYAAYVSKSTQNILVLEYSMPLWFLPTAPLSFLHPIVQV